MKVSHLKSYFLNKALKSVIIMVILLVCLIIASWAKMIYEEKYSNYLRNQSALEYKLDVINGNINNAKNVQVTWDKIKNNDFSEVGLRIEKAKKIIDALEKECSLSDLKVTLSNPITRKEAKTDIVGVEYSELNISFNTYLDIEAFQFMKGLKAQIPGIINYTYISMALQNTAINQSIINEIKEGNIKNLVHIELSIIWQDFIKLNNNENE